MSIPLNTITPIQRSLVKRQLKKIFQKKKLSKKPSKGLVNTPCKNVYENTTWIWGNFLKLENYQQVSAILLRLQVIGKLSLILYKLVFHKGTVLLAALVLTIL